MSLWCGVVIGAVDNGDCEGDVVLDIYCLSGVCVNVVSSPECSLFVCIILIFEYEISIKLVSQIEINRNLV